MGSEYSDIVDPKAYTTHGLCDDIPLRLHKNSQYEVDGSLKAQNDWANLVTKLDGFQGGLGPKFGFMSVTVPECLPERLEIISYANEFAFLYDDVMEELDLSKNNKTSNEFLEVFGKDAFNMEAQTSRGEKQMQAKILKKMMAIDPERAIETMTAWSVFIQQAASHQRDDPFQTLDQYLPFRILDAGEMIWYGTVTFGMALTIPREEWTLCRELVHSAFAAISLTNDLYSWEKEAIAAKRGGADCVVNAIWVLMHELSISEDEAKQVCRDKIKSYTRESIDINEKTRNNLDISKDLRTYVQAIQYSLIGNLVWSIYCPRYQV